MCLDVRKGAHRCVDVGSFVELDSYAIASPNSPQFSDSGGKGVGTSMGLILEARSPLF